MSKQPPPLGRTRTAACYTARVATPQERAGALEFLKSLAAELSQRKVNLPCFPDVVVRIRRALDNPRTRIEQTVKIVGTEPRLAARILQTANSVVFNQSGRPVTDLRTAVTRLGTRVVQSVTMTFAVQQMRMAPMLRSVGGSLKQIWEDSITAASICRLIAPHASVSADEAFLTGLVHAIGRLYIMVRAVGDPNRTQYEHTLLELIESWHPAIGQAVLENWEFPEPIAAAVGHQQDYEYSSKNADHTDVLIVAVALAAALRPGGARVFEAGDIKAFARLGLRSEECRTVLAVTSRNIGALRAALGC
jgi:HD-like signal output (HDOD) protein